MERIGRYQIVKELGRGAMGLVFHAVDPAIGRPVAIKTIRLGDLSDGPARDKLRERLIREARSAGILSHPHIVTIYDISAEGEVAYIAMEFVDGPTLEQLMAAGQPLDSARVIGLLRQAAAALDYAHARGIVHRDIKPANLMIAAGDHLKITDFGIAKAATSDQFTMAGTIVGTPNYMSPEQVQGQAVDGRADQFALAVIAYELITGEKPFTGEHLTTIVYKIVMEEPPPPNRLNPTVGSQTDAVLRRALGKKPEVRFSSCAEFVDALERAVVATRTWKPLPRGASLNQPTLVETVRPTLPPPRQRPEEPPPRRRRVLPLAAALFIAAVIIGAVAFQMGSIPGTAPEPPQEPTALPAGSDPGSSPADTLAGEAPGQAATEESTATAEAGGGAVPDTSPGGMPSGGEVAQPETAELERPQFTPPVRPRSRIAGPQEVSISTNPPGATASLGEDPELTCRTPCTLVAPPGRHRLTLVLPGYHVERRDIQVGDSPEEIPLLNLRRLGGVLMLSSQPSGASISIDGHLRPETTPARLDLPEGTYTVTVEKDGQRSTVRVEIRNGVTKYQPMELGT